MRYPKTLDVWECAPGRRLAKVVIRVRNEKGAMASCAEILKQCGVNVLSGFFTAPDRSADAVMSFFADVTDSPGGLQGVKRRLLAAKEVEGVDAVGAEGDLIVDKQHFPVQWAGRRAVVMRADALNEMLNRLWSVFGTGAATIIDQMAEAMGKHFAGEVIEDFGAEFARAQLDELVGTYAALGYAEVEVERSKSADFPMVVNARGLFECEANLRRAQLRRSVFFRAHLRGFMSGLFSAPFEVSEVQCLAERDEVCSFRIVMSEPPSQGAAPTVPIREHESRLQSNL